LIADDVLRVEISTLLEITRMATPFIEDDGDEINEEMNVKNIQSFSLDQKATPAQLNSFGALKLKPSMQSLNSQP